MTSSALIRLSADALAGCVVRRVRTMREFAEQEIILPDGVFKDQKYRVDRQPYAGLFFDAVEAGRWRQYWFTGPTQSGKTLLGIIALMYHLFELRETVIFGLPDMEMAGDKWRVDIEPVILASRYAGLIPKSGGGSRGGTVESVNFTHGPVLKFMSGGGGDAARSGYTARVVVISEVDKMDLAGGTSREADKISQIIARTDAYGDNARIYGECTVSIEEGRIWREYNRGTRSKIVLRCPLCGHWVTPEREHLTGWQDAANEKAAKEQARWCCPDCGGAWTEEQRVEANMQARIVHRLDEVEVRDDGTEVFHYQTISETGEIEGEEPGTFSFSFRWTAVNNLFWDAGFVGQREWNAAQEDDEDNAERRLRQFTWALPYQAPNVDMTPLNVTVLERRRGSLTRGVTPEDCKALTVGVDLGLRLGHWVAVAYIEAGKSYIVDYGTFDIMSDDLGVDRATQIALREYRDAIMQAFIRSGGGDYIAPNQVWIDSGYSATKQQVFSFCREAGERFRPIKGWGTSEKNHYPNPQGLGKKTRFIGDEYHFAFLPEERVFLVHINVDNWKPIVHNRLSIPQESDGSCVLFQSPDKNEHKRFVHHLTAERQIEEFVQGKGVVKRMIQDSRSNHYLDCLAYAAAAAHFCGIRVIRADVPLAGKAERRKPKWNLRGPDGQPFLITDR